MFKLESTLDGAGTVIFGAFMTDSEAGADGEAVVFSGGRLTKCAASSAPQGILIKDTDAGTDVETEYVPVRRDQIFLADYSGTAPVVGTKTYQLTADGLSVDGNTSTGGKVEIVSVDTSAGKCRVKFDV